MEIKLAPSPFELWATDEGYDIAPAVLPDSTRVYADIQTQAAFKAYNAGAAGLARMLTESTLETPALIERVRRSAGGG